jgi:hypothetical protein
MSIADSKTQISFSASDKSKTLYDECQFRAPLIDVATFELGRGISCNSSVFASCLLCDWNLASEKHHSKTCLYPWTQSSATNSTS